MQYGTTHDKEQSAVGKLLKEVSDMNHNTPILWPKRLAQISVGRLREILVRGVFSETVNEELPRVVAEESNDNDEDNSPVAGQTYDIWHSQHSCTHISVEDIEKRLRRRSFVLFFKDFFISFSRFTLLWK